MVTDPVRLFSLLNRRDHTLLLYAGDDTPAAAVPELEAAADGRRRGRPRLLDVYVIAAPGADVEDTVLPVVRDAAGEFAEDVRPTTGSRVGFLVRPDGYLGYIGDATSTPNRW